MEAMRADRVMIAAPKSGSGKTIFTCSVLSVLKDSGERPTAFKCGPDYIDPMFHRNVIGVPSKNLDTFFTDEDTTLELFLRDGQGKLSVMEGVMGLYDGLGGTREEGSSYHLAKVTKTPVILVADAKGAARSVAALLAGFLKYDTDRLIKGVVLNRTTSGMYGVLKPVIEEELGVKAMGYIPEDPVFNLESRHLGLVLPAETEDIRRKIKAMADIIKRTVDIKAIKRAAMEAQPIGKSFYRKTMEPVTDSRPILAVARDEAFCFYYEDNLRLLEDFGAKIEYFSPLANEPLPKGCRGLLLGGGYPEIYAEELGRNKKTADSVRKAAAESLPMAAECGGFMYLHSSLEHEGKIFPMAGVLPGTCRYTGRLVRFGYVELKEKISRFLPPGGRIKGHEFHYFDSDFNGGDCIAVKPASGRTYPCVNSGNGRWLGFPHLYYPSNPSFAENFVRSLK